MTEPIVLYKLIVLYMLDQVDFPLTRAQVFDFVLGRYANYVPLQQAIRELIDTKLVVSQSIRNSTHLSITDEGRSTLEFFRGDISEGIKEDIRNYFSENAMQLREDVSLLANYYKMSNGEYMNELVAKERNSEILNIHIAMPTEEASRTICENWKNKSQEVYEFLVEKLMGNSN